MVHHRSKFFLITLSVDADIPAGTDLLGKSATDLQSDIVIGEDSITGTLKYVTGYTGFSGVVEEQSGNYLAFHSATNIVADSITIELVNGATGHPVTLDSDGLAVVRITDKDTQYLRVVAHKDGAVAIKEYDLSELTLNEE